MTDVSTPQQASACRKGGYLCIDSNDRPVKIIEMSTSKTGKHGHAKVHFVGIDIFTGKKYEMLQSSTHNVMVPIVTRSEFSLIDIDEEGYVSLMLDDGSTREDLKLPNNEVGEQIRKAFDDGKDLIVSTLSAMNEEAIMSFKVATN